MDQERVQLESNLVRNEELYEARRTGGVCPRVFCGGNVGNSDLPSRDIASVDREGPGDRDPKALSSLFLVSHWD